MSNHIEHKPTVQPQTAPQNPETTVEPIVTNPEHSGYANGSENGGIYFELNWDTGQAQYRQQQLLTGYAGSGYSGGTTSENSGYNSGYNPNGSILEQSPLGGYSGNSYSPESYGYAGNNYGSQYGYGDGPNGNFPFGYTGNSTNPDYYLIRTSENNSLYSSENSSLLTLNDLVNLFSNDRDFSDYHNQSNDFWREVRQFSETQIFENDEGIKQESVSKYDRLLNEMQSKKIPLDDFVENLPPNEKQVFKAHYQIDETFGTDIFQPDGLTLSENGQLRVLEFALENGQIQNLPETVQKDLREGKYVVSDNDGEIVISRREVSGDADGDGAETLVLPAENNPNRAVADKIESNELKLQDKSTQIAIGNNGSSILSDNGTTRVLNHAINTESSSSVNSIARRDGGTVLGGALISGSFTSIENFKNAENQGIGSSGAVENNNFGGRNSYAAGATGAMMSAAIGSLVPGSDAVVSGVVGFISGVVIGVEADQGLRWLSGDRPTAIASTSNINLLEENSFA